VSYKTELYMVEGSFSTLVGSSLWAAGRMEWSMERELSNFRMGLQRVDFGGVENCSNHIHVI
jgi:hypothetical protein